MKKIKKRGFAYDDVLIIPKYSELESRKNACLETKVTRRFSIKIPFLAANMESICESNMAIAIGKIGGLGVIHRFMEIKEQAEEVRKVKKEKLLCAAAIGIKDFQVRVKELVGAGADILVLDLAHSHSKKAGEVLEWIKKNFSVDVMVGNIATKDAAKFFFKRGADALKVGIGPGSVCTTRIMTGAGVPQISALMDVFDFTKGRIPICADGGIKNPGDVVKAIGAGADCVMLGKVLAGCVEASGKLIKHNGKKFRVYRGMASYEAILKKLKIDGEKNEFFSVEGEKILVEINENVESVMKRFVAGLSSGISYAGVKSVKELIGNAEFIEITNAGFRESLPHAFFDFK